MKYTILIFGILIEKMYLSPSFLWFEMMITLARICKVSFHLLGIYLTLSIPIFIIISISNLLIHSIHPSPASSPNTSRHRNLQSHIVCNTMSCHAMPWLLTHTYIGLNLLPTYSFTSICTYHEEHLYILCACTYICTSIYTHKYKYKYTSHKISKSNRFTDPIIKY